MDQVNDPHTKHNIPEPVRQGVVHMDADLRVLWADDLFYASFHTTPEQTEGRLLQELDKGVWDRAVLGDLLKLALTKDHPFANHVMDQVSSEGGVKRMVVHGSRLHQPVHTDAVVRMSVDDTTDKYAAEESLRHAELRYRRLFQTAKDGILILDAITGKIIDANPFMEDLVGSGSGKLLGKHLHEIGMFKDIEQNKAAFRELQRNRYIRYEHLPVQDRNGGTVEVEFIANVYLEGDRLVAQCNVRDISDRVLLEKRVAQQAAALADEARNKDQFLAMLSHELRNPLAPIRSAVQLLDLLPDAHENPVRRQAQEIIERQVGNLNKLVGDLLEVSRVINGRIRLKLEPVDMHQLMQHAVQTVTPLLEQRRHTLKLHPCDEPLYASADPMRMEEVIVNLLNNAIKYTPPGGRIDIACDRVDGEVCLRVTDNGEGISAELLPRVFDLFTQSDRSLDRAQGGMGIGLALAHRLVELQGGTLQASSRGLGTGSTFTIRMPLIHYPAGSADADRGAERPAAPRVEGVRVLVIDDNMDLVTLIVGILKHKGYVTRSAHTGPEGLRIAQQWLPQVVLLDIGLPGLDGYEVARRLRADPATAGARLIALTGYGQETDVRRAHEAGFDAHLLKPYDMNDLEKLMRPA